MNRHNRNKNNKKYNKNIFDNNKIFIKKSRKNSKIRRKFLNYFSLCL